MNSERELLFGVFAVQLGFASAQQVMAAAAAWTADKSKGVGERLVNDGAISADKRKMIDDMVAVAVKAHDGDPKRTLASMGGEQAVLKSLGGSVLVEEAPATGATTLSEKADEDAGKVSVEQPGRYSLRAKTSSKTTADKDTAELGRGGIGRVLIAFDEHLGREIAIKELLDAGGNISGQTPGTPVSRSGAMVARFLREARVTAQLEHPHIVPVYEVGRRADGTLYYTMKIVRGRTLADALKEAKTLKDRLKYLTHFVDLCQAVAYAHSRGVIHRDIKPENTMLGEFGETVVLDWGLAKVRGKQDIRGKELEKEIALYQDAAAGKTVDGKAIGTPAYMSPEQAEGKVEEIDERSDVWSLGAALYEVLTGKTPFEGVTPFEVIGKVLKDAVRPIKETCPEAPAELAAVAEKALHRDKSRRYQSAKEIAQDIESYLTGGRVAAYEYNSWELVRRFARKNMALTFATALVFVSSIVGTYLVYGSYTKTEAALKQSEKNKHEALSYLSRGYQDKATQLFSTGDFQGARVFASAALEFSPYNPYGPHYAKGHGNPEERDNEIAVLHSTLYDSHVRSFVVRRSKHRFPCAPSGMAYSPDGALLAVVCHDRYSTKNQENALVIWSVAQSRVIARCAFDQPSQFTLLGANKISFSPDGNHVAFIKQGTGIALIEPQTCRDILTLTTHSGIVGFSYSNDGQMIAVGDDKGLTTLWHLGTGKPLKVFGNSERPIVGDNQQTEIANTSPAYGIAFSPDNSMVASANIGNVVLRSVHDGRQLNRYELGTGHIVSVAFSPDGRYIGAGGFDKRVSLVDLRKNAIVVGDKTHKGAVNKVLFSSDGKYLFSTSEEDNNINIFDVQHKQTSSIVNIASLAYDIAVDKVGPQFAVATSGGDVEVWSLLQESILRYGGHGSYIFAMALANDGRHLATGGFQNATIPILIRDLKTPDRITIPDMEKERIWELAFSPSGSLLASSSSKHCVTIWDVHTGKALFRHPCAEGDWPHVAFSPDGSAYAISDANSGEISVFDMAHQKMSSLAKHKKPVYGIAFSKDGSRFASGGSDNSVFVWDWKVGRVVASMDGHTDAVSGLSFSPDGRYLATASKDATIVIWDVASGTAKRTLKGHKMWVNRVVYSPDGNTLLSGSDDRTAKLWDAGTGRLLQTVRTSSEVSELAFSPDNKRFFVVDQQFVLEFPLLLDLWKNDPRELRAEYQKAAGMKLDGFTLKPME